MIIVGSAMAEHADGEAVLGMLARYVSGGGKRVVQEDWNGFNVLQRVRPGLVSVAFD